MRLRVSEELDSIGVYHRLIKLTGRAKSTEDVIRYSVDALDPEEVCKTIILKTIEGGHYAALLQGRDSIDLEKAEEYLGVEVKLASIEDVRNVTGMAVGAICPVLLKMPIMVDKRILRHEKINFGSGHHLYGIEVCTRDLGKALDYTLVDIVYTP
ncbi:MAG: aminoacyl-tRNA deacylase [Candidatus Bathyarchaeia archaeon]